MNIVLARQRAIGKFDAKKADEIRLLLQYYSDMNKINTTQLDRWGDKALDRQYNVVAITRNDYDDSIVLNDRRARTVILSPINGTSFD